MVEKLKLFCKDSDMEFPEIPPAMMVDFLCFLAEASPRPKSVLNTTVAAVEAMSKAMRKMSLVTTEVTTLVTMQPMIRSKIIPVNTFTNLFLSWESNWFLPLEELRLKSITLLALALMLRPSDLAPKGMIKVGEKWHHLVLKADQLKFNADGSAMLVLLGIKNYYKRDSFEIPITPSREARLGPVCTIQAYLARTQYLYSEGGQLFLSLKKTYGSITAKMVARILEKAIVMASLGGQGFSAKKF